jgi:hypothetical protein
MMYFQDFGETGVVLLYWTYAFGSMCLAFLVFSFFVKNKKDVMPARVLGAACLVLALALLVVNATSNDMHHDKMRQRSAVRSQLQEDLAPYGVKVVDFDFCWGCGSDGRDLVDWVEVSKQPGCVYRFLLARNPETGGFALLVGSDELVKDRLPTTLNDDGTISRPSCPKELSSG